MNCDLPDAEEGVCYSSETETYRATFDSRTTEPSVAVVNILANVYDAEPTELDPLYEVVDPSALDKLVSNPRNGPSDGDVTVEFTYLDHRVCIKSYGIVSVRPLQSE